MSFSMDNLLEFLDILSKNKQIAQNTSDSRKIAISKILAPLSAEERKQLNEGLDLENLFERFKKSSNLSDESVKVYASRFKTTFKDYLKWNKDPSNFIPRTRNVKSKTSSDLRESVKTIPAVQLQFHEFKIPVTPDICGFLKLPPKLSKAQARRINDYIAACTRSLVFDELIDGE